MSQVHCHFVGVGHCPNCHVHRAWHCLLSHSLCEILSHLHIVCVWHCFIVTLSVFDTALLLYCSCVTLSHCHCVRVGHPLYSNSTLAPTYFIVPCFCVAWQPLLSHDDHRVTNENTYLRSVCLFSPERKHDLELIQVLNASSTLVRGSPLSLLRVAQLLPPSPHSLRVLRYTRAKTDHATDIKINMAGSFVDYLCVNFSNYFNMNRVPLLAVFLEFAHFINDLN